MFPGHRRSRRRHRPTGNQSKNVVEALTGNIFLVKDNKISTPPLEDGCIDGILRKQLIEICKTAADLEIQEVSISPFELQKADEIFITNAIQGVRSVSQYRRKKFGNEVAKKLIGKLNARARLT